MSNLINLANVFLLFVSLAHAQARLPDGQVDPALVGSRRAELEAQLKDYETQIDQYQNLILEKQKEADSLKRETAILNAEISKAKLEIKARTLNIQKLNSEIVQKSNNIKTLESKITSSRASLSDFLRRTKQNDDFSVLELVLIYGTTARFFGELQSINTLQVSLQSAREKFSDLKIEEENALEDLADKKREETVLKSLQELQKKFLEGREKEKQKLIKETKGKESEYQKILEVKQKSAAEIRKQIFHLFGGGELSFGEAYNLAKVAEKGTGVRAAFILAVLTQESAIDGVIGANVGRCFYNTPRNNFSGTVMKNDQKPAFLALMQALNMDPNTTPVSCPIASHGAYGGAMGSAQFMPNTWMLYNSDISKVTGNNPPSPWRNADAFVATALYLKSSLDSPTCRNYARDNQRILPYQFLLERCAAAQYYAGGNWHKFRFAYGDPVVERADKFQRDINVLNELALAGKYQEQIDLLQLAFR
ncbi:MAG: lytic murein transglycosylase [Candidatus Giovannonibacteria bacterium]|nr:lytic murein transglycosylase [Candidatus Giovannonibacteria bacterium]